MKCPHCNNERFIAHQLVRMDVVVDGNNSFLEQKDIYDSEKPYGPYSCTECGYEFDELELK